MARSKKIICKDCKTEYEIPLSANFMYFCPGCKKYNGCECEYGYAAIVPCEIYLGEKLLGRLTGGGSSCGSGAVLYNRVTGHEYEDHRPCLENETFYSDTSER